MRRPRLKGHRGVNVELVRPSGRMMRCVRVTAMATA